VEDAVANSGAVLDIHFYPVINSARVLWKSEEQHASVVAPWSVHRLIQSVLRLPDHLYLHRLLAFKHPALRSGLI
jgi:hypothetical protein